MGGHLVSALVGVTCQKLIANPIFASSLAIAIAMAVASLRDKNPFYPELQHTPEGKPEEKKDSELSSSSTRY